MKGFRLVAPFVAAVLAGSCGSPGMPSGAPPAAPPPSPAPAALDLSGRWSGTANDSQGPATVAWQLVQTGANVTGTAKTNAVDPNDGACSSCHRNKSGSVTGTLNGSTLTLTLFFAAGADGDPTPACSATLNASAISVSPSSATLVASYSGSDTCEGAFANGTMTMRR